MTSQPHVIDYSSAKLLGEKGWTISLNNFKKILIVHECVATN